MNMTTTKLLKITYCFVRLIKVRIILIAWYGCKFITECKKAKALEFDSDVNVSSVVDALTFDDASKARFWGRRGRNS